MKIVYDCQAFAMQAYGGVSRYFCELAEAIQAVPGTTVEILAPVHINQHLHSSEHFGRSGLMVPHIRGTNLARRAICARWSCMSLRRKSDIDVFHETYYSRRGCPLPRAKRILTVFDMIHEKYLQGSRTTTGVVTAKAAAIRRADHVICISESTRRDLVELTGIDVGRTSVVRLGFGLAAGAQPTERDAILTDGPYLLYVGSRIEYKNFVAVLEAYGGSSLLLSGFRLLCFGGGDFSDAELALAASFGIERSRLIQISGNDAKLASAYSHAAALVYPSLYEGFGIPPLEAMSFGCPVACSNTSSLPEVVGDAAATFDPTDVGQIRDAIERVVGSPSVAGDLVARGRERIKLFSWDKCARETLDTYHLVLGR